MKPKLEDVIRELVKAANGVVWLHKNTHNICDSPEMFAALLGAAAGDAENALELARQYAAASSDIGTCPPELTR